MNDAVATALLFGLVLTPMGVMLVRACRAEKRAKDARQEARVEDDEVHWKVDEVWTGLCPNCGSKMSITGMPSGVFRDLVCHDPINCDTHIILNVMTRTYFILEVE